MNGQRGQPYRNDRKYCGGIAATFVLPFSAYRTAARLASSTRLLASARP